MEIQIPSGCDQRLNDLLVTTVCRMHKGRGSILPEERREKERGVSMDHTYTEEESWVEVVEYFRGPW